MFFHQQNKAIKEAVRKYEQKLLQEEKMKQRLLSKEMDYQYLEELLKRCENNRDLIIEIDTADHAHLTIRTKKEIPKQSNGAIFDREDI